MDCLAEQEQNPLTIDLVKAQALHDELAELKASKEQELRKVMPKRPLTTTRTKPKNTHKKDGSLSVAGERWYALLKTLKLPETTVGPVKEIIGEEEGNPNSPQQVKDWLSSLGWQPRTYKFVRDKVTGEERQIEQVRKDGELCDSVKELIDKDPAIEVLDGLTVITHRLGVVAGFIKHAVPFGDGSKGHVVASAGGFTNTLRFKHREPIVNLPGVDRPWGPEIRGCIVAPDDVHSLIGADVSSLEDSTKRHYMQPLDPEYVKEMNVPGYDPHMALLVIAGKIKKDDYDFYIKRKSQVG
jgi:transposase